VAARWLSPSRTPLADWLWVKPTATGAIVPLMEVAASMRAPFMNNGAVDPAVVTAGAVMPAPLIQVDTGPNLSPIFAAAARMPVPGLLMKETASKATASAVMLVPVVIKTVVSFPPAASFTLAGKVPALPTGSGLFPSASSLTISGKVPTVSSVTPTAVQPTAASFTLTGKVPDEPTGPRFPYQLPITLN
jgi:hypothetical protein